MSAPDPEATSFDLNNLDEHNFPIEHDGSLSREDYYFGNDHSFNQTIWNQVLYYYENMTTATIPVASLARINRINNARAVNPTFIYGPRQLVLSYGETALYLSTMGNPITGDAPLAYVQSLFGTSIPNSRYLRSQADVLTPRKEKEQLPYALGWKKPAVTTTLATLGAMAAQLQLANPDAVPEGTELSLQTILCHWSNLLTAAAFLLQA